MKMSFTKGPSQAGFTLVELMISMTVVSIILAATAASLQREVESVSDLQRMSNAERLVNDLFVKLETRLEFSRGVEPTTILDGSLSSASTNSIPLEDTFGFPDSGGVLLAPGTASEERVAYTGLNATASTLTGLTRGERGTPSSGHSNGTVAIWEGLAYPIEEQSTPAAGTFDGQTDDIRGPVFYRGDGMGFAYQRPVDPAGTGSYLDTTGIRWGVQIADGDVEDGCGAVVFVPVAEVTEADRNFDINSDGDLTDTFDLGRIVNQTWNSTDPALGTFSLDLVPAMFLQEKDNYGSDLDNDGFNDPMFLWTPESGRLRVRLFALIGDMGGREVIRRYETVFYLRNGSAE